MTKVKVQLNSKVAYIVDGKTSFPVGVIPQENKVGFTVLMVSQNIIV